ncbi:MAG TPA: hypothetical protein VF666_16340 [Pyrinomonadaceae bacterium]|jgi:hypothetical protein
MILTLHTTEHLSSRVWLGELPEVGYEPSHTVERVIEGALHGFAGVRRAAVELLKPVGAFSHYGLLGATLKPGTSGIVSVHVMASHTNGEIFSDTIFPYSGRVRTGLPDEYVNGVLEGVEAASEQTGGLRSGTLVFNRAAHEAVGSNTATFKYLSNVVVRILNLETDAPSEDEITELFKLKFF